LITLHTVIQIEIGNVFGNNASNTQDTDQATDVWAEIFTSSEPTSFKLLLKIDMTLTLHAFFRKLRTNDL
jgi:hypothetical protein